VHGDTLSRPARGRADARRGAQVFAYTDFVPAGGPTTADDGISPPRGADPEGWQRAVKDMCARAPAAISDSLSRMIQMVKTDASHATGTWSALTPGPRRWAGRFDNRDLRRQATGLVKAQVKDISTPVFAGVGAGVSAGVSAVTVVGGGAPRMDFGSTGRLVPATTGASHSRLSAS
jgi:hypothetical protein